jgi:hypothetical protein
MLAGGGWLFEAGCVGSMDKPLEGLPFDGLFFWTNECADVVPNQRMNFKCRNKDTIKN